ncbi:MAG: sulfotransferase [Clostridia bacterium]|nr:sulfotransferase [Clostridia bacterium]
MGSIKLVMVSAGFEHGGNVVHRHLDGHPDLLVYPFESQLGNKEFNDFLSSIERVQYRYPEFPEGLSAEELYEQIIDEEMKTFLRKRNGSKFRDVELALNEGDRIKYFKEYLTDKPLMRRNVIAAFFYATFAAWENYHKKPSSHMTYVGYSPAIGIDANRMIKDFPTIRIMHIIRNPFSAYRDTKRRPFPQPINKYLITWNVYHSTVEMYAKMYPKNVRIFRYEDFVADKETFMKDVSEFIDVEFCPTMLYPSWNGQEISGNMAPWGTVLKSTEEYNKSIIKELTDIEKTQIANGTMAIAKHFRYDNISYLKKYYDQ